MDSNFRSMKRSELQALCKKHGIPANITNAQMAERLASLLLLQKEDKSKPKLKGCLKVSGGRTSEDSRKVSFYLPDEGGRAHNSGVKRRRSSRRLSVGRASNVAVETPVPEVPVKTSRPLAAPGLWSTVIERKTGKGTEVVRRNAEEGSVSELSDVVGNDAGKMEGESTVLVPVTRSLRNRVVVDDVVGNDAGKMEVESTVVVPVTRSLRNRVVVGDVVGNDAGKMEAESTVVVPVTRSLRNRVVVCDVGNDAGKMEVESTVVVPVTRSLRNRVVGRASGDELNGGLATSKGQKWGRRSDLCKDEGGDDEKDSVKKSSAVEVQTTRSLRNRVVVVEGEGRLIEDVEVKRPQKKGKTAKGEEDTEAPFTRMSGGEYEESLRVLPAEAALARRSRRNLSRSGTSVQEGKEGMTDEAGGENIERDPVPRISSSKLALASPAADGKLVGEGVPVGRKKSQKQVAPAEAQKGRLLGIDKLARRSTRSSKRDIPEENKRPYSNDVLAGDEEVMKKNKKDRQGSRLQSVKEVAEPSASMVGAASNVTESQEEKIQEFVEPVRRSTRSLLNIIDDAIKKNKSAKPTAKRQLLEEFPENATSKIGAVTTTSADNRKEHPMRHGRSSRRNAPEDGISITICEDRDHVVDCKMVKKGKKSKPARKAQSVTGESKSIAPNSDATAASGALEVQEANQIVIQREEAAKQSWGDAHNHDAFQTTCLESGDDKASEGRKARDICREGGLKRQGVEAASETQGRSGHQKRKLAGFWSTEGQSLSHLVGEDLTLTSGSYEVGDTANLCILSSPAPVIPSDLLVEIETVFAEHGDSDDFVEKNFSEMRHSTLIKEPLTDSDCGGDIMPLDSSHEIDLVVGLSSQSNEELPNNFHVSDEAGELSPLSSAEGSVKEYKWAGDTELDTQILLNQSCRISEEIFAASLTADISTKTSGFALSQVRSVSPETFPSSKEHESAKAVKISVSESSTTTEDSSDLLKGLVDGDGTCLVTKPAVFIDELATGTSSVGSGVKRDSTNGKEKIFMEVIQPSLSENFSRVFPEAELATGTSVVGSGVKTDGTNGEEEIFTEVIESPGSQNFTFDFPKGKEKEHTEEVSSKSILSGDMDASISEPCGNQRYCNVEMPIDAEEPSSSKFNRAPKETEDGDANKLGEICVDLNDHFSEEGNDAYPILFAGNTLEGLVKAQEEENEARNRECYAPTLAIGKFEDRIDTISEDDSRKNNVCDVPKSLTSNEDFLLDIEKTSTKYSESPNSTSSSNVRDFAVGNMSSAPTISVGCLGTPDDNADGLIFIETSNSKDVMGISGKVSADVSVATSPQMCMIAEKLREAFDKSYVASCDEKTEVKDVEFPVSEVVPETVFGLVPESADNLALTVTAGCGKGLELGDALPNIKKFTNICEGEGEANDNCVFEVENENLYIKDALHGSEDGSLDKNFISNSGCLSVGTIHLVDKTANACVPRDESNLCGTLESVISFDELPVESSTGRTTLNSGTQLETSDDQQMAIGSKGFSPVLGNSCHDSKAGGLTLDQQSNSKDAVENSSFLCAGFSSPQSKSYYIEKDKNTRGCHQLSEDYLHELTCQDHITSSHGRKCVDGAVGSHVLPNAVYTTILSVQSGLESGKELGDVATDDMENASVSEPDIEYKYEAGQVEKENSNRKNVLDGVKDVDLDTNFISNISSDTVGKVLVTAKLTNVIDIQQNNNLCHSSHSSKCKPSVEEFPVERSIMKTPQNCRKRLAPPETSCIKQVVVSNELPPSHGTSFLDSKANRLPLDQQSDPKDVMENILLQSLYSQSKLESCQSAGNRKEDFHPHELDEIHVHGPMGHNHILSSRGGIDVNSAGFKDSEVLPMSVYGAAFVVNDEPEIEYELGDKVVKDMEDGDNCKIVVSNDYEGRSLEGKKDSNLNRTYGSGMTHRVAHECQETLGFVMTGNDHGTSADGSNDLNDANFMGFEGFHPEISSNSPLHAIIEFESEGKLGNEVADCLKNIDCSEGEINISYEVESVEKDGTPNLNIECDGIQSTNLDTKVPFERNYEAVGEFRNAAIPATIDEGLSTEQMSDFKSVVRISRFLSTDIYSSQSNIESHKTEHIYKGSTSVLDPQLCCSEVCKSFYGETDLQLNEDCTHQFGGSQMQGLTLTEKDSFGSSDSTNLDPAGFLYSEVHQRKLNQSLDVNFKLVGKHGLGDGIAGDMVNTDVPKGVPEKDLKEALDKDNLSPSGGTDINNVEFQCSEVFPEIPNHSLVANTELVEKHRSGDGVANDMENTDMFELASDNEYKETAGKNGDSDVKVGPSGVTETNADTLSFSNRSHGSCAVAHYAVTTSSQPNQDKKNSPRGPCLSGKLENGFSSPQSKSYFIEKDKNTRGCHQLSEDYLHELTCQDHITSSHGRKCVDGAVGSHVLPNAVYTTILSFQSGLESGKELGDVAKDDMENASVSEPDIEYKYEAEQVEKENSNRKNVLDGVKDVDLDTNFISNISSDTVGKVPVTAKLTNVIEFQQNNNLCHSSHSSKCKPCVEEFHVESSIMKTPQNCRRRLAPPETSCIKQVVVINELPPSHGTSFLDSKANRLPLDQQSDPKDVMENILLQSLYSQSKLESCRSGGNRKEDFHPHELDEIHVHGPMDHNHILSSGAEIDVNSAGFKGSEVLPMAVYGAALVVNVEPEIEYELGDKVVKDMEDGDNCKIVVSNDYEGRSLEGKKDSNLNRTYGSGMTHRVAHECQETLGFVMTGNDHGTSADGSNDLNDANFMGFEGVHPEISSNSPLHAIIEFESEGKLGNEVADCLKNIDCSEGEINISYEVESVEKDGTPNLNIECDGIQSTNLDTKVPFERNYEAVGEFRNAAIPATIDEGLSTEQMSDFKSVVRISRFLSTDIYSSQSNIESHKTEHIYKGSTSVLDPQLCCSEVCKSFYGETDLQLNEDCTHQFGGSQMQGLTLTEKDSFGSSDSTNLDPAGFLYSEVHQRKLNQSLDVNFKLVGKHGLGDGIAGDMVNTDVPKGVPEKDLKEALDKDNLSPSGGTDINNVEFQCSEVFPEIRNHSLVANTELVEKHRSGDGVANDMENTDMFERASDNEYKETAGKNGDSDVKAGPSGVMETNADTLSFSNRSHGRCAVAHYAVTTSSQPNQDKKISSRGPCLSGKLENDKQDQDHLGTSTYDFSKSLLDSTISISDSNRKQFLLTKTLNGGEPFHMNFITGDVDHLKLSYSVEKEDSIATPVNQICEQKDTSHPSAAFSTSSMERAVREASYLVAVAKALTFEMQENIGAASYGCCNENISLYDDVSSERTLPNSNAKPATPLESPCVADIAIVSNDTPICVTNCLDVDSEGLLSSKQRSSCNGQIKSDIEVSSDESSFNLNMLEECSTCNDAECSSLDYSYLGGSIALPEAGNGFYASERDCLMEDDALDVSANEATISLVNGFNNTELGTEFNMFNFNQSDQVDPPLMSHLLEISNDSSLTSSKSAVAGIHAEKSNEHEQSNGLEQMEDINNRLTGFTISSAKEIEKSVFQHTPLKSIGHFNSHLAVNEMKDKENTPSIKVDHYSRPTVERSSALGSVKRRPLQAVPNNSKVSQ